jgi:nicotinamidase-related amidase
MSPTALATPADSLLIVIDVQDRLAAAMDPAAVGATVKNIGILLTSAAHLEIPVLATEQYTKGLGPTVAELGAKLPHNSPRFEKTCFSCAGAESFLRAFESTRRRQAILTGMEAHVCVLQSALELKSAGSDVFVISDACCSRTAANHASAMDRLRAAGVVVANTESIVFEWLRDARHPQFKALSALLR